MRNRRSACIFKQHPKNRSFLPLYILHTRYHSNNTPHWFSFFLASFASIVHLLLLNYVDLTLTFYRLPPSLHLQPTLYPSLLLRTNRLFPNRRTSRAVHASYRAPPLHLFLTLGLQQDTTHHPHQTPPQPLPPLPARNPLLGIRPRPCPSSPRISKSRHHIPSCLARWWFGGRYRRFHGGVCPTYHKGAIITEVAGLEDVGGAECETNALFWSIYGACEWVEGEKAGEGAGAC